MAKLEQLQKDIEALKKAINNPNNTNPQAKASMEKTLVKLEKIAKELAESSPAGKTYKEELARQRATGEAKDEGISLYAMSKAMENKPKKATLSGKESIKKRSVPVPKADQDKYPEDDDDYCAKVIAQAKERRKKAKERANAPQKTEATKNKEKLDKVFDNVKERAEDDDITKAEILKLIDSTESLLTLLKKKLATL